MANSTSAVHFIVDPFSETTSAELAKWEKRQEFYRSPSMGAIGAAVATQFIICGAAAIISFIVSGPIILTGGLLALTAAGGAGLARWLYQAEEVNAPAPNLTGLSKGPGFNQLHLMAIKLNRLPEEDRRGFKPLWQECLQIHRSLATHGKNEQLEAHLKSAQVAVSSVVNQYEAMTATATAELSNKPEQEDPVDSQAELLEAIAASDELELAEYKASVLAKTTGTPTAVPTPPQLSINF